MEGCLEAGVLHIKKNYSEEFVAQVCPYSKSRYCSTQCPMFGEFVGPGVFHNDTGQVYESGYEIRICNGTLIFSKFVIKNDAS